ncbi:MAG: ribonuclease P protein component [Planctomycetota bacterium]|nr:ribonuclease P protein component [Planctomycetota bacterium]
MPKQEQGPGRAHGRRAPLRLRESTDFQRVYNAQEALHGPNVVVFYCANGLPLARMGVSVGRKHGNAVRRNRIKRVLREAFRQAQDILPSGYDYVLIPRRGVREYRTCDVRASLEHLARKIPLPGEGTRLAQARAGEAPPPPARPTQGAPIRTMGSENGEKQAKPRRGISSRTFIKRPPPKP